ncbi:transposase [Streptomyces sp. TE3672]
MAGPAIPLREVTDGLVRAGVAHSPSSSRTTNPIRRDATVVTCGDARSSTPFRNSEANGLTAKAPAAGVAVRPGFNRDVYGRRNEVERTINRLKNLRAAVTRSDKRAYVFYVFPGTVTIASIRLWLCT